MSDNKKSDWEQTSTNKYVKLNDVKPWYKKGWGIVIAVLFFPIFIIWWVWVISKFDVPKKIIITFAALLVIGLIYTFDTSNTSNTSESMHDTVQQNFTNAPTEIADDSVQQEKQETDDPSELEIKRILSTVERMPATGIYSQFTSLGYSIKFVHAITKYDFTEIVESDIADPDYEYFTDWLITGYQDLDNSRKTVTLFVNTQENIDTANTQKTIEEELTMKLNPIYAWSAAESYGKREYPSGFELHYLLGMLAQTPRDADTWFLKATCTVTNEYGAKRKLVAEIKVTGTTEQPEIIYFKVY